LSNTTGPNNTATGQFALFNNTTGQDNTANGVDALLFNTTGNNNTANGVSALNHNTTGSNNIALGSSAGVSLTTGDFNIDIGNSGVADESGTIRIGRAGIQTKTFIAGITGVAVTGSTVLVSSVGQLGVAASSARFKKDIQSMDRRATRCWGCGQ
jgi:trimeric autotransporter adhesin